MPQVSIITPSYNQAQFIGATIASVLSQAVDLEYFIIDGGSTDGTVDILRAQTDPRLHWVSEKDSGQANAINKGLARATGEFITFINSDDVLLPGAMAFALEYFTAHPQADLIYGDVNLVDAAGGLLRVSPSVPYSLPAALTGAMTVMQQGSVWRRRVTERIGGMDERLHYVFDAEYWLRAALAGFDVRYVPGVRAEFRMHGASKSVSQARRFLDDWAGVFERAFADPALPPDLRALRPQADAYLDWHYGKFDWANKQFSAARPRLWRTLRTGRPTRRALAAAMLFDSYANTHTAQGAARLFTRFTGTPIELLSS